MFGANSLLLMKPILLFIMNIENRTFTEQNLKKQQQQIQKDSENYLCASNDSNSFASK